MTRQEVSKLLSNPNTKILVNWVESQKMVTKNLLCPKFFHTSHNKRERDFICKVLEDVANCKIERSGKDSVLIKFK